MPGTLVSIDLISKDLDLEFGYLTVYKDSCRRIKSSARTSLVIVIPQNRAFIVQVFNSSYGAYTLNVTPTSAIGSIIANVIDSVTGQPISDAYVLLSRCQSLICSGVGSERSNNQGIVKFTQEGNGTPLAVGSYKISAISIGRYEDGETPEFSVAKDQHIVVDVPLKSYPARLSAKPCANIPSSGGTCKFSVTVTNGQATTLSAVVWNIVEGNHINKLDNGTKFPIFSFPFVSLAKAGSKPPEKDNKTLNFQFKVPAGVKDGASICVHSFAGGLGKQPNYSIKGTEQFCITKVAGSSTLKVMSESETINLRYTKHQLLTK